MAVALPYVQQEYPASCWAACMVSVTGRSFHVSESHTQTWYVTNWGPGPPSGGLPYNSPDFDKFRNAFGFAKSVKSAGAITEQDVTDWLRHGSGYFMLIEQQSAGTSHARMAYDWRNKELIVMDPDRIYGSSEKHMILSQLDQCVILYW